MAQNQNKKNTISLEKNLEQPVHAVEKAFETVGLGLIAIATMLNMAELSGKEGMRVFGILQPSYALVEHSVQETPGGDELRRSGREEIRHTSASYGALIKSPASAGRR